MSEVRKQPRVCVGVLLLNPKGEILFIRSHKFSHTWTIPGGGVEWGEKAEDTVVRETKEETGLHATDVQFLQAEECIFPKEFHKEQHFIFLDYYARTRGGKVTLNEEAEEYCWRTPKEAQKLDLNTSTRGSLEAYIQRTGSL